MSGLGKVTVNNLNLGQGEALDTEKHFLFIGAATKNAGQMLHLNTETDFDDVLGVADSELKTATSAALANAGQGWSATAFTLDTDIDWEDALDAALAEDIKPECVVLCTPISTQQEITAIQTKMNSVIASTSRRLKALVCIVGIDDSTQTWTDYISAAQSIVDNVLADRVSIVPLINPQFLGVYAGRLCHSAVSIADSPLRVATGALVGMDHASFPLDSAGVRYNMAHAEALSNLRYTVPQTYPDFDGLYMSQGLMLDAEGGDYQQIENIRVVDKAARLVRLQAIRMLGNRSYANTPAGNLAIKERLLSALLRMTRGTEIGGIPFPPEIKAPNDDAINLVWESRTRLKIYLKICPFNYAKDIDANLILDLSNEPTQA